MSENTIQMLRFFLLGQVYTTDRVEANRVEATLALEIQRQADKNNRHPSIKQHTIAAKNASEHLAPLGLGEASLL